MKLRTYVLGNGHTTLKCGFFSSLILRVFSSYRLIGSYVSRFENKER